MFLENWIGLLKRDEEEAEKRGPRAHQSPIHSDINTNPSTSSTEVSTTLTLLPQRYCVYTQREYIQPYRDCTGIQTYLKIIFQSLQILNVEINSPSRYVQSNPNHLSYHRELTYPDNSSLIYSRSKLTYFSPFIFRKF